MDSELEEWLAGLAGYGCVFMDLIPMTKRPPRFWSHYEDAYAKNAEACLKVAHRWLKQGRGVGFLPRGSLWVLDIDDSGEVERILCTLLKAGVFPPTVSTPSGGAHLYFRFPADFLMEGLKNHLNHPIGPDGEKLPIDFKFGPRTMVVAPGTRTGDRLYSPTTPWCEPPLLDPGFILPNGEFWRPPKRRFEVVNRPLASRISRACAYLRSLRTPVSISGHGGRRTLASVCAHLVVFLDLDPPLAFHLLTNGLSPWNSRCRDAQGNVYPWSENELWRACEDAVDAVPRAGEQLYKRNLERQVRDTSMIQFCRLLQQSMPGIGARPTLVSALKQRFEEWSGLRVSEAAFGRCLSSQGIPRKKFTKRRVFGVDVDGGALEAVLVQSTCA